MEVVMIDLSKAEIGDKFRIKLNDDLVRIGLTDVVTFEGPNDLCGGMPTMHPFKVKYSDGTFGSRTQDGHVFANNRLETDPDIIEALS
jgi:hypothetical protein